MLRIALIDIIVFALPFLIYGIYMVTVKKVAPSDLWQSAPYIWLVAGGLGLLLVAMATLISYSGGKPGGTYRPPVTENGVIRPGTIE
jgi:hypothetical protein